MASDSSCGFRPGALHISLQIRKTQQRVEEKNKHGLGSAPSARRGKSMWHFCAALRAFAGYRWRVFCAKLPQSHGMLTRLLLVNPASVGQQVLAVVFLTSVGYLLCLASIFSLPLSTDCLLLWTAISSRLFSSAFHCQLILSVFSGTFLSSSTSGLTGDLVLRLFVWVSSQNKEILWPAPTQTEMNASYCVTQASIRTLT